jgi:hypothetical protein
MSQFSDSKNRVWTLEPTVGTIKRIRDLTEINVLDLGDSKSTLIERLHNEPWILCDILYAACKPQMEAAHVTSEDFGAALGGDTLAKAFEALQAMLISFSSGGRRSLLEKIFAKSKEVEDLTLNLAVTKLEDPELVTRIRADAEKRLDRLIGRATDFPPESGSTGTAGSWEGFSG